MNIHYVTTPKGISAEQLQGFFVDWRHSPSTATHLRILQNSDEIVLALDEDTGQVVGYITAITDHVISAYIPLLEVLPAYQGQGIGTELVQRMLEQLSDFYMVDLLCDARLQPFYARFGMTPVPGMALRRYARLQEIEAKRKT